VATDSFSLSRTYSSCPPRTTLMKCTARTHARTHARARAWDSVLLYVQVCGD
jgi:hypothetical protein